MKTQKIVYCLIFVLALLVFVNGAYIEYRIFIETNYFEEPSYNMASKGIRLIGNNAAVAHLLNLSMTLLALAIAIMAYNKIKR